MQKFFFVLAVVVGVVVACFLDSTITLLRLRHLMVPMVPDLGEEDKDEFIIPASSKNG